ncbi:SCO family protein [Ferrovibrio sp.]|uniref:SCO family protein n=1 Tax=Ferrovibrio sp. TaxID=1917215 RepID=UPI0025B7E6B0|nr:SCO family protein [Ferrovibrio sp.]
MNTAMRGLLRGVIVAALAAALAFGGFALVSWLDGGERQEAGIGEVSIGGPYSLTDQEGRSVTDKDFRGKLQLVYFGFTSCPDICPTALQTVAIALDEMGVAAAEQVVPILITVDPERDTVAAMKEYVQSFHDRMVGLTGTPEQIAAVAKAYRVYYQKVKLPNSSLDYSVDHSGFLYLMSRDGKYVAHFRHNATPEEIAKRVKAAL